MHSSAQIHNVARNLQALPRTIDCNAATPGALPFIDWKGQVAGYFRPAKLPVTPIPVENTKFFRGTQKQYEQRGMVLNAPMRMNGRRTIMHRSRMRRQEGEGALRRMGIHQPTPMQVELYHQGATPSEITRRTITVRLS